MNPGLRALLITLLLAAVAWTTREIPNFGFLPQVDDDVNIFLNPHLGAPDAARIRWMASDFSYVHRYMPLGWLGFSAVYAVAVLDPAAYHLADLVLHAVNAVLLFLVLDHLLRRFAAGAPEQNRLGAAGMAALFWAVHPLRVETTAWCSGLLYAQAGCFALVSVLARMAELRARVGARPRRAAGWFAVTWLAYAGSLLTYPVALFLPFALVILDQTWLARLPAVANSPRARIRAGSALLSVTALAGLALTLYARGTTAAWQKAPSLAEFGPVARVLQASYVAVVYLWRSACTADLRWMPLTLFEPDQPGLLGWFALGVLAAAAWLSWRLREKAPALGVCALAYLVLLVPNLGLSEHPHTIADRYMYFTGTIVSVGLALGLVRIRSSRWRMSAVAFLAVVAAGAAVRSRQETNVWRDAASFQAKMMRNPDPELRHITAARAGKLRFMEGDVRGGREAVWAELQAAPSVAGVRLTWSEIAPSAPLSSAVASRPLQEWKVAPYSLVEVQIARGQLAEGRSFDALQHLDGAIERIPGYTEARFRRGLLLAAYGRLPDALHDWLAVMHAPPAGSATAEAQNDFMTDCLRRAYSAAGDAATAAAVAREGERLRGRAPQGLRPGEGIH